MDMNSDATAADPLGAEGEARPSLDVRLALREGFYIYRSNPVPSFLAFGSLFLVGAGSLGLFLAPVTFGIYAFCKNAWAEPGMRKGKIEDLWLGFSPINVNQAFHGLIWGLQNWLCVFFFPLGGIFLMASHSIVWWLMAEDYDVSRPRAFTAHYADSRNFTTKQTDFIRWVQLEFILGIMFMLTSVLNYIFGLGLLIMFVFTGPYIVFTKWCAYRQMLDLGVTPLRVQEDDDTAPISSVNPAGPSARE